MTLGECDVVITGLGIVSPAGVGASCHWHRMLDGCSAAVTLPEIRACGSDVDFGAPVDTAELDAALARGGLPPTIARSRYLSMGLAAAQEALSQANLTEGAAVGVVAATAIAGTVEMERSVRYSNEFSAASFAFDDLALELAREFDLGGLVVPVSTGCTAGLDAVGIAYDQLRLGRADAVLVGAAEAPLTPIVTAAFDRIGALSRRADAPASASRPFDQDRDGFVLGESAAMLVLETRQHAAQRRQPLLGGIRGWASVSSAYHMTGLRPDGADLARAIARCLCSASITAGDLDFVDAHGTSTKQNDASEAGTYAAIFGSAPPPVIAQKSIIGHSLGASSATELVGTILALQTGTLPPVANTRIIDVAPPPNISPTARRGEYSRALTVASGFSGIHTALVVEKAA